MLAISERLTQEPSEDLQGDLLSIEGLQEAVHDYAGALRAFVERHNLFEIFDNACVDHVAIKLEGRDSYEAHVQSLAHGSEWVAATPMDGREIATAKLNIPLTIRWFGGVKTTKIVEIMEPKPGKYGNDTILDHIEVQTQLSLDQMRAVFYGLNVKYTDYSNPGHNAIVVVLDSYGQELKITDGRLEDITRAQVADATSYWVKQPQETLVGA